MISYTIQKRYTYSINIRKKWKLTDFRMTEFRKLFGDNFFSNTSEFCRLSFRASGRLCVLAFKCLENRRGTFFNIAYLTPDDFWLWNFLKLHMYTYRGRPKSLARLKDATHYHASVTPSELFFNAV